MLKDRLLPIAPAPDGPDGPAVDCWLSGSQEKAPRRRRGLPPLGPIFPPKDILPNPLTRAPSSRYCPRAEPEAVGVKVGVADDAVPVP